MAIRLHLLDVPRLVVGGRTVAVAWQRRSLSLLTYLFTARGLVARDAAASALWPEDDVEEARGNLRRNLNCCARRYRPRSRTGSSLTRVRSASIER